MPFVNTSQQIFANNRCDLRFTVVDINNNRDPLDLTPFSVQWALAQGTQQAYSDTPVLQKRSDTATEIEITDAANGRLVVKLLDADTNEFIGDHWYQLELVTATNEKRIVASGGLDFLLNIQDLP